MFRDIISGLEKSQLAYTKYQNPERMEIIILDPVPVKYEIIPWVADPLIPCLYFQVESAEDLCKLGIDYSVVSSTEHPLTNLPTWFVHPCNTREWLNANPNTFLWLQHFGSKCGLQISI